MGEEGLQQEAVHEERDSAVPPLPLGGDSHPLPLRMNSSKEYPEPRQDNI